MPFLLPKANFVYYFLKWSRLHFVEAEWVIEEERLSPYDFTYDQIVSIGELISSRILTAWLDLIGLNVEWIDARDLILTDDTYREGRIQWKETNKKIQDIIRPSIQAGKIVVTQGFIGSTAENNTTTLGKMYLEFSLQTQMFSTMRLSSTD